MLRNSSAVMKPFLPLSNDLKRLYSAETSACVTAGCVVEGEMEGRLAKKVIGRGCNLERERESTLSRMPMKHLLTCSIGVCYQFFNLKLREAKGKRLTHGCCFEYVIKAGL